MANWQDDPDLAAMRPRRGPTPWGRIFLGVLVVGCGTFGLAFYLPLFRAHHALSDDHAKLREKLESVQQRLEKSESELKSASAKRDELAASAKEQEDKKSAQASDLGAVKNGVEAALDKAVKKKAAAVVSDATGVRVSLAPGALFAAGKLDVGPSGTALLCAVAKAAGSRSLRVTGVATDDDVPLQLKAKYSNAWSYTAAAAAAVASTLAEKCSVSGAKLSAEGSDGSRPAAGAGLAAPRVELLIANSAK